MTAQALAAAMQELGVSWSRTTVTKVETRQREVTVEELVALSLALNVPLGVLLIPPSTESLPLTPEIETTPYWAWIWLLGEQPLSDRGAEAWIAESALIGKIRRHHEAAARIETALDQLDAIDKRELDGSLDAETVASQRESVRRVLHAEIRKLRLLRAALADHWKIRPPAAAALVERSADHNAAWSS